MNVVFHHMDVRRHYHIVMLSSFELIVLAIFQGVLISKCWFKSSFPQIKYTLDMQAYVYSSFEQSVRGLVCSSLTVGFILGLPFHVNVVSQLTSFIVCSMYCKRGLPFYFFCTIFYWILDTPLPLHPVPFRSDSPALRYVLLASFFCIRKALFISPTL